MLVGLVVVIVSGALFGYDQGVISGALTASRAIHLGASLTEVITSWVTLGALFGALGGRRARRPGRPPAHGAGRRLLFASGALLEAFAPGKCVLVVGRLSSASASAWRRWPLRCTPPSRRRAALRGRYVSIYQLAITIGIFIAYLVDQALPTDGDWRLDARRVGGARRCCWSSSWSPMPERRVGS